MREEREHNRQISNPLGRPAGEVEMMRTDHDATPNLNISIKTCGYCKVEIRQGVKHVCHQTERRRNMANDLKSVSSGTLETVLGEGLKEFQRRKEDLASAGGGREVSLRSGFGGASPLTVTIGGGKRRKESRQLTNDDLLKIKKSLGISSVKTKELAGMIRVGTGNRKAVEPGLAEALTESNRALDDLFTSEQVQLENKKGEEE